MYNNYHIITNSKVYSDATIEAFGAGLAGAYAEIMNILGAAVGAGKSASSIIKALKDTGKVSVSKGTTRALPYMSNSVIKNATFKDGKKFRDHFNKHKNEFGSGITKDEYLAGARNLLSSSPNGVNVFAKVRQSDGAYIVFNKSTNEFGIISKDGIIQTYYIPNPAKHGYKTNYDYYLSQ